MGKSKASGGARTSNAPAVVWLPLKVTARGVRSTGIGSLKVERDRELVANFNFPSVAWASLGPSRLLRTLCVAVVRLRICINLYFPFNARHGTSDCCLSLHVFELHFSARVLLC